MRTAARATPICFSPLAPSPAHPRLVPPRSRPRVPASLPRLRSTRFLAVRFGNVLGSSGSVVPIFQKQIEAGGPVTVTHPEMKRYFMTIPEASQLVMQAGAIGQGGEIFVLDMGEPSADRRSRDGVDPPQRPASARRHRIRFTGIRPGEKLYEELAGDDEQTCPTAHEKIRVWKLPVADGQEVEAGLDMLSRAAETGDAQSAVAALASCVPEYRPGTSFKTPVPEIVRPAPTLRITPPEVEAA